MFGWFKKKPSAPNGPDSSAMWDSPFIDGAVVAPFFIFVRCAGELSDADLLRLFGLSAYQPAMFPGRAGRYAILADDGDWAMIADDFRYTLWHMPSTRPTLEELGQNYDLFSCSVGDTDNSFEFEYYQGSRMVRRYVVEDRYCSGRRVVEDAGKPLSGEAFAFKKADGFEIVRRVASSLGLRTDYSERDIRVYAAVKSGVSWSRGPAFYELADVKPPD
jgi:hypothetical protein